MEAGTIILLIKIIIAIIILINLILVYVNLDRLKRQQINEAVCEINVLTEQELYRSKNNNKQVLSPPGGVLIFFSIILLILFWSVYFLTLIQKENPLLLTLIITIVLILIIVYISKLIKSKIDYNKLKIELTEIFNTTCTNTGSKKFISQFKDLDTALQNSIITKYIKRKQLEGNLYTKTRAISDLEKLLNSSGGINVDNFIKNINIQHDLKLLNESYHNWIAKNCYANNGTSNSDTKLRNFKNYISFRYNDILVNNISNVRTIIILHWILIVFFLYPFILTLNISDFYYIILGVILLLLFLAFLLYTILVRTTEIII
jgi:hypothetical protein